MVSFGMNATAPRTVEQVKAELSYHTGLRAQFLELANEERACGFDGARALRAASFHGQVAKSRRAELRILTKGNQ